jgi:rhamnose utilization protein RhaD (predicted bifunctional aldolase and dehydrogenase)
MVAMYPLCAFRSNPVAASIDTPLHGFLPFPHVDHLHPDWGIALAASANGKAKMDEFNREFGHSLVWLPWQRPGFELGLMMKRAGREESRLRRHCAGRTWPLHLGRDAARVLPEYLTVIDQIGQFIERHGKQRPEARFGGEADPSARGSPGACHQMRTVSARQRQRATAKVDCEFQRRAGRAPVRELGARKDLAFLGTSCPDHFHPHQDPPAVCAWEAMAKTWPR